MKALPSTLVSHGAPQERSRRIPDEQKECIFKNKALESDLLLGQSLRNEHFVVTREAGADVGSRGQIGRRMLLVS